VIPGKENVPARSWPCHVSFECSQPKRQSSVFINRNCPYQDPMIHVDDERKERSSRSISVICWLQYILFPSVTILLVRWYYVENFAATLPFWDQWDSEGDRLLKPWIEGTLHFGDLWQPHNEHRIFPTRIMTLLCFKLSGVWNNLLEARWNIFLAASSPIYMLWMLRKNEPRSFYFLPVAMVILVQSIFPFSWENFLVGFQSQVYFLILFTLLTTGLATFAAPTRIAQIGILVLSALSTLTMASGLLTPVTAGATLLIVAWQDAKPVQQVLWLLFLLAFIAVAAMIFLPSNDAHLALKAENLGQFFKSATRVFCWPSRSRPWTALPLWLPITIIPWLVLRRKMSRVDIFMTGCFLWTAMLGFSIAYGRGHDLMHITSRYTDFLTPGLVASAWFAMRWAQQSAMKSVGRYSGVAISVLFYVVYFRTHIMRIKGDVADMKKNHQLSVLQATHVTDYLISGDSTHLQQAPYHIPYPHAVRLKRLLDDPTIRSILPDPRPEALPNSRK
jgi:uncharacterized membrane protein